MSIEMSVQINSIMMGNYPLNTIPYDEEYKEFMKEYDEQVKNNVLNYDGRGHTTQYTVDPSREFFFMEGFQNLQEKYMKCLMRRREQAESILN